MDTPCTRRPCDRYGTISSPWPYSSIDGPDVSVTVEARALGLPIDRLRVSDVLTGKEIIPVKGDETDALCFSLRIQAQTAAALSVKTIVQGKGLQK